MATHSNCAPTSPTAPNPSGHGDPPPPSVRKEQGQGVVRTRRLLRRAAFPPGTLRHTPPQSRDLGWMGSSMKPRGQQGWLCGGLRGPRSRRRSADDPCPALAQGQPRGLTGAVARTPIPQRTEAPPCPRSQCRARARRSDAVCGRGGAPRTGQSADSSGVISAPAASGT